MLRIILYTLYFLMWTLALGLASLLFTQKLFHTGLMLGTVWGTFTISVTIIILLVLAGIYLLKKERRAAVKKTILVCLLPLIPAAIIIIVYFFPKSLEEKERTLELTYIAWACDCANWVTAEDLEKYHDNGLENHSIYIEPANKKVKLPEDAAHSNVRIRFTGKFYKGKGFPKGYHSFEQPQPARVFRYTKYEIVKATPEGKKNRKKQ